MNGPRTALLFFKLDEIVGRKKQLPTRGGKAFCHPGPCVHASGVFAWSVVRDPWAKALPRRKVEEGKGRLVVACAQLQHRFRTDIRKGLRVSIGANKIHAVDLMIDHVTNGVTATATDTDHFDHGTLWCTVY